VASARLRRGRARSRAMSAQRRPTREGGRWREERQPAGPTRSRRREAWPVAAWGAVAQNERRLGGARVAPWWPDVGRRRRAQGRRSGGFGQGRRFGPGGGQLCLDQALSERRILLPAARRRRMPPRSANWGTARATLQLTGGPHSSVKIEF
jgi:hypothetical protein